jgi:hypothetical protein
LEIARLQIQIIRELLLRHSKDVWSHNSTNIMVTKNNHWHYLKIQ